MRRPYRQHSDIDVPSRSNFERIQDLDAISNRPLSKLEIAELMGIEELEVDFLAAINVLQPSQTHMYSDRHFIGFFCYWCCVGAYLHDRLGSVFANLEVQEEIANEALHLLMEPGPTCSGASASRDRFEQSITQAVSSHAPSAKIDASALRDLVDGLVKMHNRLPLLGSEDSPVLFEPYAVRITV